MEGEVVVMAVIRGMVLVVVLSSRRRTVVGACEKIDSRLLLRGCWNVFEGLRWICCACLRCFTEHC
jgi:hypothetical protein